MNILYRYISIAFVLAGFSGSAQNILTAEQALQITLENNFGLKIARNNVSISENNASLMNSGYLPTVNLRAGANYANNNSSLEFSDGRTQDVTGAESVSTNAALEASYVVFNGMARSEQWKKYKLTHSLSELDAQLTTENTIMQLLQAYYQLAFLKEQNSIQQQMISISNDRMKRSVLMQEYGQGNELQVLNASVDLNNDSISLFNLTQQYNNAQRNLNLIMGREANGVFDADTSIAFNGLTNIDLLLEKTISQNVQLLQARQNIQLAEQDSRISKASYLPSVSVNGTYNYNSSQNQAGFILGQNVNGLSTGASLNWNLFDGGGTSTRVKNAKIRTENTKELLAQIQLQTEIQLRNAWSDYQNKLFIFQKEKSNMKVNQQNFKYSKQRMEIGQITGTDFRLAQINLARTISNLSKAKYDAKIAELEVLHIAGMLIQGL
ncbi:MAG: TolC family protein [Bacteroidales bacterium]|nr:TolC family protein [Bacteroidales bacterium]